MSHQLEPQVPQKRQGTRGAESAQSEGPTRQTMLGFVLRAPCVGDHSVTNPVSACPACRKTTITNLGRLPARSGAIDLPDPGDLYECSTCALLFRRPYLAKPDLMRTYTRLPAELWDAGAPRRDYAWAVKIIERSFHSGRVLDVGCFRGDFLTMLPQRYEKYGVEPADSAREVARQRGIELLASWIDDIEVESPMFHAITLLDVVEHLPCPAVSLQGLGRLLVPGGLLMLSTGNTDVLPWRLMRRDYYYYFPEHVSFFNPRWFRWLARELDLELLAVRKYSYFKASPRERWLQLAKCVAVCAVEGASRRPTIYRILCSFYPFRKVLVRSSTPGMGLWPDHILVVLRSKD